MVKDQASKLRELLDETTSDEPVIDYIPAPMGNCRVIAVTSGKGGVGKTTLSVNLAMILAEKPGVRVLILDADLGLANVDVMLRIHPGRHIGHLLRTDCPADQAAVEGPGGVMIIAGGSGLQELADSNGRDRQILIDKLSTYFRCFDYVVIDTSPGIGSNVMDFLRISNEIVLVTTSEPTSIRDTYAALKRIVREAPQKPITLVINNANRKQSQQAVKAIDEVAMKFIGWHSNCWYHIESDQTVSRSIQERRPVVHAYPRTAAVIDMRKLAAHLMHNGEGCE